MRLKRPTIWALVFSAGTIALRLPYLSLPFDPTDEGYYAAVAQSTVRGARLYADLWYVRPPFLNVVYEWCYRFSLGTGLPYDVAVRLLAALFAAATVGALAWLLFTEFSPRAAMLGSVVAMLMAASLALQNEANAETWMLLPYTLSAALVLYVALHRPPARDAVWLIALAGVLTGVAAAFKQVALVDLALPVAAWIALDRTHVRRWLSLTAAFVAGVAATWTVILLGMGLRDDVRAFLYFAWLRNVLYISKSHGGGDSLRTLLATLGGPLLAYGLTAAVVLALAGVAIARWRGAQPSTRIACFALAWLAISAIGVAASGRYYQHYFIQATVPLALLLAASTDAALGSNAKARASAVAWGLVAVLGLSAPIASWVADLRGVESTMAQREVYKNVGERLVSLTRPGGSFMIWGICASVKAYSPVRSATSLTVVCYDYGWSPITRGSLLGEEFPSTADVVLPELARGAPDTIVLTSPLNAPKASGPKPAAADGARLMPELYAMVSQHYDVAERGNGYILLSRVR